MGVLIANEKYTGYSKGPYMVIIPKISDVQVMTFNGETFVFQSGMPTTLQMKHYEAVLHANGGKENGALFIVDKNLKESPSHEETRAIVGKYVKKSFGTKVKTVKEEIKGPPKRAPPRKSKGKK